MPALLRACALALALPLLLAPATAASRGGADQLVLGGPHTQTVPLETGANWVALVVVPQDPSFDAVLSGIAGSVALVKDARGRHYSPAHGVADITHWEPHKAYVVHVTAPVTLTVTGARIDPALSALPLAAGPNLVPYLPDTPLAAAEAFSGIAAHFTRAEDRSGASFSPSGGAAGLDSLRVGQAYFLWASSPATLYYPVATPDTDYTVPTLAAALALQGLTPGQLVQVLGRYAPGDGGGGLFRVDDTGFVPDGGLTFVPDEHVSGSLTTVATYTASTYVGALPEGQHVVYGSLSVEVLNRHTNEVLLAIPGELLHGHAHASATVQRPVFYYHNGRLQDYQYRIHGFHQRLGQPGWNGKLRFTYRHTTSPIRLVRQMVGNTLNVRWFGARTVEEDPAYNNQWAIAQAINVAGFMNDPQYGGQPDRITDVLIPGAAPGGTVYEYFGALVMPDRLTLRGEAGTELVTVTNDLGHTYQPVRVRNGHTRLRMKANEALTHIRMEKPSSDPQYLPPDAAHVFGARASAFSPSNGVTAFTIRDLVLDGNYEENQQAWDGGWASHAELENAMRNTPGWAAVNASNHNGLVIPPGQHITIKNVAITGYGSNGLLGNMNNVWSLENVRLGNSLWNHVLYGANNYAHAGVAPEQGGYARNVTFEGFAWGHAAYTAGKIENLVYEGGLPSPRRNGSEVLNIRGPDVLSEGELASGTSFRRSDGMLVPVGVEVDGFYIDARGGRITWPFNGIGPNVRIRQGTFVQPTDLGGGSIFSENGNGWQRALYSGYLFEDITVYRWVTGNNMNLIGRMNVTESTFRNITSVNLGSVGGAEPSFDIRADRREHPSWNQPQTVTYEGITDETALSFILRTDVHPQAAGRTVHIRNSTFNNATNGIVVGPNHQGSLTSVAGNPDLLRIYWDGVGLRLHDLHHGSLALFFHTGRLQNVTDLNSGRTSEDEGAFTHTATGGETFVEVPTNLLWAPEHVEASQTGGPAGLLASTEVRNVSGTDKRQPRLRFHLSRPLAAGEAVSLTWSAAVRPFPADAGRSLTSR